MTIATELEAWLSDVADAWKPTTLDTYRKRSRWILRAFGSEDWGTLTEQRLRRALDDASRRQDNLKKLAPDTIRLTIIAWDQFQKWAIETGRLLEPINRKPLKKPTGKLRERLPDKSEILRIERASNDAFRAMFRALLQTGARPDELCRATIGDYDPLKQMIRLEEHKTRYKTNRPRLIPINGPCLPIIRQAMGSRTEGPIFLTIRGKPWTSNRLSEAFRRLRKSLNLDRDIVLYSTRHTAATAIVRKKGSGQAAAVLGHSGLASIQRYTHPDERDLVNWVE